MFGFSVLSAEVKEDDPSSMITAFSHTSAQEVQLVSQLMFFQLK
jgi:hypothetical protein